MYLSIPQLLLLVAASVAFGQFMYMTGHKEGSINSVTDLLVDLAKRKIINIDTGAIRKPDAKRSEYPTLS